MKGMINMDKEKIKRLGLERLNAVDLLMHDEFKNLTISELSSLFKCKIEANKTSGTIKIKIKTKVDREDRYKKFINNAFGNGIYDNPFKTDYLTTKSIGDSVKMKPFGYIDTDSVSPEKMSDDSSLGRNAFSYKIKPFSEINLSELEVIVNAYYDNKISIDDIMDSWNIHDTNVISYLNLRYDNYGDYRNSIKLEIMDFDYNLLAKPINGHERALMRVKCELNGEPVPVILSNISKMSADIINSTEILI